MALKFPSLHFCFARQHAVFFAAASSGCTTFVALVFVTVSAAGQMYALHVGFSSQQKLIVQVPLKQYSATAFFFMVAAGQRLSYCGLSLHFGGVVQHVAVSVALHLALPHFRKSVSAPQPLFAAQYFGALAFFGDVQRPGEHGDTVEGASSMLTVTEGS
jgi:hypothetical protein